MPRFFRYWGVFTALVILLGTATNSVAEGVPLSPRMGWKFIEGAQDLTQTALWECVEGVTATAGKLTVTAGDEYYTAVNTGGFNLKVQGDFSVLATMPAPTSAVTSLTLVGSLNDGLWWNGLKRLDVGVTDFVAINYWTGSSPTATSLTFPLYASLFSPFNLEVARIGTQIVIFINGAEAGRFSDPGLFPSGEVYLGFTTAPRNNLSVLGLAASVPSNSSATLVAPYLRRASRTGTALRDSVGPRGLLVGAAVDLEFLPSEAYAETAGREFNVMVPENDLKFAALHPTPIDYNFCPADKLVSFAQVNGMLVRGHTLVWHADLPKWLTTGNYTRTDVVNILRNHISTVMQRYKGKVAVWDVVNEAIAFSRPYGMQPSFWLDAIGSDYIDMAFRWAREADPNAKLFYNETGGEGLGEKSDAQYNLVKGMLARGVPLDGVGLQMHVDLANPPSPESISANIRRLGALGLDVHITEMDVRVPVPATPEALRAQAAIYQGVVSACLANSNGKAFLVWGVSDEYTPIPDQYPGFGSPLLLDEQFRPKPAYQAVAAALVQQSRMAIPAGGAISTSTLGIGGQVQAGYATATFSSQNTPYSTAIFSLARNGSIVSEVGVPASPPTQGARIFVDYGIEPGAAGTLSFYTGLAIAHRGNYPASVTYTLRDRDARTLATGRGTLNVGAHFAKFIHELRDVAPDFNLPANFPAANRFGSLEITSDQPLSIVALRLTTNQRGETLLTSTPIADLKPATSSPVYFPQLADGGGYKTTLILLNTASTPESGMLSMFDDSGAPLVVRAINGTTGSTFPYSIPAGGAFTLQTDGSPVEVHVGWVKLTPTAGSLAPVGGGVFSFSPAGILVSESGIPSAVPTTHARIYVDKSNGHDTGLAIANPNGSPSPVVLQAFATDGVTTAGNGQATLNIPANGHNAQFVGQAIGGLTEGFIGVVDITSPIPFVALTLRSLDNGRDYLLTTFPIADLTQPAPAPIVFPQIVDGGGYSTQFIFISATGATTATLNFLGDAGFPLSLPAKP